MVVPTAHDDPQPAPTMSRLARSPAEICRIEETRQARGCAEIARESEVIAGGTMCFSEIGSWVNQAAGIGLDGPVSDAELDRLVEFYVSRGVEPKVELAWFAHETVVRGLAARGFGLRDFESVLARELDPEEDLRSLLRHGRPEGIEVGALDPGDEDELERFVRLASRCFHPDAGEPEAMLEPVRRVVRHPRVRCLAARVEGELVGGAQLELDGPVAAFIGAFTDPRFRRRGVQGALLVRRLEMARELGASFACVHSRPGQATERNALAMGFELAYGKVVLCMPGEGLAVSP